MSFSGTYSQAKLQFANSIPMRKMTAQFTKVRQELIRCGVRWRAPIYYRDQFYLKFCFNIRDFAPVDELGDPPVVWACMTGDLEMLRLLLDAGANIQDFSRHNGDTPLHRSVKHNHEEVVRELIDRIDPSQRRAYANHQNHQGLTALHYAAQYGLDLIAEFLLDSAKADPRLKDNAGRSAIAVAQINGHALTLEVLLNPEKARADAEALAHFELARKNNKDLLLAAEKGDLEWVDQLVEAGCDVHYRDFVRMSCDQALFVIRNLWLLSSSRACF